MIKEQIVFGIAAELRLDKDRVELEFDYNENKNFQFKSQHYNPTYRLVLCGPLPHSTQDKGNLSSIINMMENTDGYPKIVRLTEKSGELKITKTSIKSALIDGIKSGYLETG